MSAMAATGAALRLRLLFRMLRVGELLALLALLSWSSSRAPSAAAAAAAARVAGSLLFSPRFVFVLGNAIVLLLLALSRRERERDPSPASSNHPATGTSTAGVAVEVEPIPAAPAANSFPSYVTPKLPTPVLEVLPCREMATVLEEEVKPSAASATAAVPTARAVVSKARAPRRSRSEKMSPRGMSGSRRVASPEHQLLMPLMRRSESDNGRRRRSSASARDVAGWAPGTEDAEEFQRRVEAFIARQTRFRREEECMVGALVVVE
ncbi:uncharacterized protein LOC124705417 [Lolium rigidum]|uniref:uncharacterized protein LOC124705417 n=1 Tax=Lolium rigidum TaxID=89674 RepID=UPI001F5C640B|nr:uncharacterized protein LOC124705417 [Lolium rigidum]